MISADNAVHARELHASGWTVSAIARYLGHDRKTVRIYLTAAREPGQPRTGTNDQFVLFDTYATRRLRDDPHLSATALHHELDALGYTGSYSALTRSLRQRDLLSGCPACRHTPAPQITKRASPLSHLHPHQGLPIRVAPFHGQTITSYLDQIAAVHHLPATTLLAQLSLWFRTRYRVHDDLAGRARATPADADALARLTGNNPRALLRALPALAAQATDPCLPLRLTTACRRCTAQRGVTAPIPVHLPAQQRLCARHRTWLGLAQQIDTTACPDIARSANHAVRLARRHTSERILLAETTSNELITRWLREDRQPTLTRRWRTRIALLRPRRPLIDTASADQADLIAAATYPDTMTLTAMFLSAPSPTGRTPESADDDLSALLTGSL
jgi:hypothetical protein